MKIGIGILSLFLIGCIYWFFFVFDAERDLVEAAAVGDIEKVKFLLNQGSDVDGFGIDGWTALTISAQKGNLEMVILLVKEGANVNKAAPGGTALDWARRYEHEDIVRYLGNGNGVRLALLYYEPMFGTLSAWPENLAFIVLVVCTMSWCAAMVGKTFSLMTMTATTSIYCYKKALPAKGIASMGFA